MFFQGLEDATSSYWNPGKGLAFVKQQSILLIFLRKQHLLGPILFLCTDNTRRQHVGSGRRLGKVPGPAASVPTGPDPCMHGTSHRKLSAPARCILCGPRWLSCWESALNGLCSLFCGRGLKLRCPHCWVTRSFPACWIYFCFWQPRLCLRHKGTLTHAR